MSRMAKKGSEKYAIAMPEYDSPMGQMLDSEMLRLSRHEAMCMLKNPELLKKFMSVKKALLAEVAEKFESYAEEM